MATLIQGIAFSYSTSVATTVPANLMDEINAGTATTGWSATAEGITAGGWGWLNLNHLNGNAYFTVMIMGAISVIIFCKLMLANITIKCRIPFHQQFRKLLPQSYRQQSLCMLLLLLTFIVGQLTDGQLIIDLVQKYIAEPFLESFSMNRCSPDRYCFCANLLVLWYPWSKRIGTSFGRYLGTSTVDQY